MTAADLFLLLFVGIIALGLICVFGPFMTKGRLSRQLRTLLAPFSTAVTIVAQLKVVRYDIPSSSVAAQIIESWFPHNETELLEGAPAPVYGRFSRSLNYNSGTGSVALELFYSLNYLNSNFLLSRRVGTLTCHLHDYAKVKQTEIRYEWDGNELAVSDLFSPEYKVLHYVLERICSEFICRSYKEITQAEDLSKSPHGRYGKPARQVKPWWRTYSAGEHGQRTYAFWPSPQDYAEAVQNPPTNFKDESLKKCMPVLNALGIPRVTSGMFASVYQLTNETEQWAVRCFDTRLIDQRERYKAISSFILSDDLTYTVDFHYLEDGIKCGDTWFPILKMTWVEGQPLDEYVRENQTNYAALQRLRSEFQVMMEKLRSNGVAHGDLQHGNILVANGEIFLVDYDAFYVPELAGRHSNELGHANYQHPTRTEKYFAPYIDNFSALVIDLSLLCLMEDPSLWQKFEGGDECLLFRKSDYVHPAASKLITTLKSHRSSAIRNSVEKLLDCLKLPIEEIPYLESDNPAGIRLEELQEAHSA